jgi:hypothetical protein
MLLYSNNYVHINLQQKIDIKTHFFSHYSVKNTKNMYFMLFFCTSCKQKNIGHVYFFLCSTYAVRQNLRDVKLIYGYKDRGWV